MTTTLEHKQPERLQYRRRSANMTTAAVEAATLAAVQAANAICKNGRGKTDRRIAGTKQKRNDSSSRQPNDWAGTSSGRTETPVVSMRRSVSRLLSSKIKHRKSQQCLPDQIAMPRRTASRFIGAEGVPQIRGDPGAVYQSSEESCERVSNETALPAAIMSTSVDKRPVSRRRIAINDRNSSKSERHIARQSSEGRIQNEDESYWSDTSATKSNKRILHVKSAISPKRVGVRGKARLRVPQTRNAEQNSQADGKPILSPYDDSSEKVAGNMKLSRSLAFAEDVRISDNIQGDCSPPPPPVDDEDDEIQGTPPHINCVEDDDEARTQESAGGDSPFDLDESTDGNSTAALRASAELSTVYADEILSPNFNTNSDEEEAHILSDNGYEEEFEDETGDDVNIIEQNAVVIAHNAPLSCLHVALKTQVLGIGAADGTIFLANTRAVETKIVAALKPPSIDATPSKDHNVRRAATSLGTAKRSPQKNVRRTLSANVGISNSSVAVSALSLSEEGSSMVTADGCTARVWSTETSDLVQNLEGHEGRVTCVAMLGRAPSTSQSAGEMKSRSTNGGSSYLAGCIMTGSSDRSVRLWDVRMRRPQVLVMRGHSDTINALFVELDGTCAWSASQDTCIRAWDLRSGRCRFHLTQHFGSVQCLAFDPTLDDARGGFLSGARDTSVHVWSRASGTCMRALRSQRGFVHRISVSQPSSLHKTTVAACGSSNDGKIKIWEHHRGRCLRTLVGHTQAVNCLAWVGDHAQDDGILVSGSADSSLRVWRSRSGAPCRVIRAHKAAIVGMHVERTDASATSRPRAFTVSADGTLRVSTL